MDRTKIVLWNANGLQQHAHELKAFIAANNVDIMLISETHFTNKNYVHIPNYKLYITNHPAGTARGGTAVIIKNSISHTCNQNYETDHIQSTSITIKTSLGMINLAAVYCPPRHSIKLDQYLHFFNSLGNKFIAGGDYNAKHTVWGSRLVSPKGRTLFKAMQFLNLSHISSGYPTYWPSDCNKVPDLIDFCVTKGIPANIVSSKSSLELSSDHTPVIVTLSDVPSTKDSVPSLHNRSTNWVVFKDIIEDSLSLNIPLKSELDIEEAINIFNKTVQNAAWSSTPHSSYKTTPNNIDPNVKDKIQNKRRLRKLWQQTRNPFFKAAFNKAAKEVKAALLEIENNQVAQYLEKLSPTKATEYSLWKATKKIHQQTNHCSAIKKANGDWARSDAEVANSFSYHLTEVFQPFPREISTSSSEEDVILNNTGPPNFGLAPLASVKTNDITHIIKDLKVGKAPGFDLITSKILKELPYVAIKFLTYVFNAIMRLQHFPLQWKIAQVILLLKPGKPPQQTSSYRPISLLPILSKVLEIIILKKINPIIEEKGIIPDHQFGFRKHHSTIEQCNRVYKIARDSLENGQYCTAAFIDISQAFDKVWHQGLLFKLKQIFPLNIWAILHSYLSNRHFIVKVNNEITKISKIESGVPQGSVLGPILYTLFTYDLPLSSSTYTATYADDTVVMASHENRIIATKNLQENLISIEIWLKKWRILANESKSVQITFTLKRNTCPPVTMNCKALPQVNDVKYLGLHLDQRLTWKKHILMKRNQLGLKLRNLLWLLDNSSKMSFENKIIVYKAILKPVWTYGIQLWGVAANSNIDVIQRFQSKVLRIICKAPWFISNSRIHYDLNIPTVRDEIGRFSDNYKQRLVRHTNPLARSLLNVEGDVRRLKRYQPNDLLNRFN